MKKTCEEVVTKLGGRYGCKRFLRDGYNNPREVRNCIFSLRDQSMTIFVDTQDSSRLHYEPWELRLFENTECQWPIFFCYLVINAKFEGNDEAAESYAEALENVRLTCQIITYRKI